MRVIIRQTHQDVSVFIATYIRDKINSIATPERPFILGLPTAASPKATFKLLAEFVKKGELSFKNVVTFNMDDYVGVPEDHPESFHLYMRRELFDHIDCPKENINIPNGNADDLEAEAARYEAKIASYGGIDLFLCGVGTDGHLAFNEPGSSLVSRTRVKTLSKVLLDTHVKMFGGDLANTPRAALTVGVGTIMDSKEVIVIMTGPGKALAVQQMLEGGVSHHWPITALQQHTKTTIGVDAGSMQELKVKTVEWYKQLEEIDQERLAKAGGKKITPASGGASSSSSSASVGAASATNPVLYVAGDIGATNARFQLRRSFGNAQTEQLVGEQTYSTKKYAAPGVVLREFLKEFAGASAVQAMCLAVAGPVSNNAARITNLTWIIDGTELAREFGLKHGKVQVLNDFAAIGYGLLGLSGKELKVLYAPKGVSNFSAESHLSQTDVKSVLGAGTGLGECFLTHSGGADGVYSVYPSEGGHADFAPRNAVETGLMEFIKQKDQTPARVSNTRVISGIGIENIYDYLAATSQPQQPNAEVQAKIVAGRASGTVDIANLISEAALAKSCPLCVATLDLFVQCYGAETGNLALRTLSFGGVYIAGGIASKVLPLLEKDNQFVQQFLLKGRLNAVVERVPVYLITHPAIGLLGSSVVCRRLIEK